MQLHDVGATFFYSAAGTNTATQVAPAGGVKLLDIHVSHVGGSVGYLQVYANGTTVTNAGTPSFAIAVMSGTAGSGTPAFEATRDINYTQGRQLNGGLSILWAAGPTGTVAHGVNAIVDISYAGPVG